MEIFHDCVYVRYSKIFYCILDYSTQKNRITLTKNDFFKNKAKDAKKRNSETFKSVSKHRK